MEAPSFEKNMAALNNLVSRVEALKMALDKERPYFVRDYDTKDRQKIVAAFGRVKPEDADEWWDRLNVVICIFLALEHDSDRLIDHLNEHRITLPQLPAYSAV